MAKFKQGDKVRVKGQKGEVAVIYPRPTRYYVRVPSASAARGTVTLGPLPESDLGKA